MKVFCHTDGAARSLLKPILDCGVDVLNPIQHACSGMDLAELKQDFSKRVIFHGGVDNQTALPRGTVEQVREEVKQCLRSAFLERGAKASFAVHATTSRLARPWSTSCQWWIPCSIGTDSESPGAS